MVKVDLHLHSENSRQNGDAIKWESLYDSILKLRNNNVNIGAFSDHNAFNVEFYLEAKNLALSAGILMLPAIEINVVRKDGKIANIIFVFEENLTFDQLNQISDICKNETPKRGISLKKCNNLFKDFKTIRIPHVGKSDHFKYEDLQEINYDAIEISNENDKNYLSVINKENIKTSVVAFSDTHKWNSYPQLNKLVTIIDDMEIVSFDELKKHLNLNKKYFKRRLND